MNEKYRQPQKRNLGKEFKMQEFEKVFRSTVYILLGNDKLFMRQHINLILQNT